MNNITKLQSLCERNACACACVFSNWCVLRVCRRNFEKMTLFWLTDLDEKKVTIEGDSGLSLASVRAFSWLVGGLLVVGLCANVYLVRVTARRRFPVRWETFRLILRYSSVVDLSLCTVLASVILWSNVLLHNGSDVILSLQCTHFDLDNVHYCGGIVVASSVVVAARQTVMLFTFDHEVALLRQNSMRTVRLLKDITIVGVVCFLCTMMLTNFAPIVDLQLCHVVVPMTSRTIYLLLVPIVVNVLIGVVFVLRASGTDSEYERFEMKVKHKFSDDSSCNAKTVERSMTSPEVDEAPDEVSDSRWNRFVIILHVAVLTWFIWVAPMAVAGMLMQRVSVETLYLLTAVPVLTSVWSAFAVFRHWT